MEASADNDNSMLSLYLDTIKTWEMSENDQKRVQDYVTKISAWNIG